MPFFFAEERRLVFLTSYSALQRGRGGIVVADYFAERQPDRRWKLWLKERPALDNEQLASVAEQLQAIGGPKLLVGDLNTTMWGASYRDFAESTGLHNTRRGFGLAPSWPTHLPFAMIPIDHCLVSDNLVVLDTRTGPDVGSDHLPLIVEFALLVE